MADSEQPEGTGKGEPGSARERELIEQAFEGLSPAAADEATDRDAPAADLPPSGTFPGYELIREIHRGGQGVVYLAIQMATKRRVAIKLMHGGPHVGSAGRARFEREVQILGQLDHPNIVKIHDSGSTPDGSWYYVMDYVSGRPLDEIIAKGEKQPIDETLRLFGLICDAIGAAHLRGVIHRDLKPSNVRIDRNGEPIVVDFGLAKIAVPDVTDETSPRLMTATGQFIGSLPWASPEQAEGSPDKIDIRTDVYSLGVMLFQMLTGRFPYQVIGNMRDVLDNIMRAEPARPSTVRRQINDEVETIVLKCLSKDRSRRYQSAIELARDIHLYLGGQPIEAKRDSGWYVVKKTLQRHKFPAGVAIAFMVLIAVFAVAMSVLYAQADTARQLAQTRLGEVERARADEAAQAARAEANLENSRSLIHQLLGDFSEQIRDLRGATQARAILAEQAREHLERLESQASVDPAYRRDLAAACDLLGDVQGGIFSPNLGASKQAAAVYERAFTIRQALFDEHPESARAHTDLATSYGKLASIDRQRGAFDAELEKRGKALELCTKASELIEAGSAGSIDETRRLGMRAAVAVADANRRLAREATDPGEASVFRERAQSLFEEALPFFARWAESAPSDADAARLHAICLNKAAELAIDRAVQARRAAAGLGDDDDARARALLDSARSDLESAARSAQAAAGPLRTLSMDHPASGLYPRDLLIVLDHAGKAELELAAVLEAFGALADEEPDADALAEARGRALGHFVEAVEIASELAGADASSVEAQRDLAIAYNKVGTVQEAMGVLGEASDAFTRSLQIRQTLVRTDPTRRHRSDLVVGLLKLADLTETAAIEAAATGQLAGLRSAERLYLQAADQLDSMVDDGLMQPGARMIQIARGALASCRARIAERTGGR